MMMKMRQNDMKRVWRLYSLLFSVVQNKPHIFGDKEQTHNQWLKVSFFSICNKSSGMDIKGYFINQLTLEVTAKWHIYNYMQFE